MLMTFNDALPVLSTKKLMMDTVTTRAWEFFQTLKIKGWLVSLGQKINDTSSLACVWSLHLKHIPTVYIMQDGGMATCVMESQQPGSSYNPCDVELIRTYWGHIRCDVPR